MIRDTLTRLRQELVLRAHGSGRSVLATEIGKLEMVDCPIRPDWIEEGTPKARARGGVRSSDSSVWTGEWDCTAGTFVWTYYEDEIIRIVEGEILLEIDGQFQSFGPNATVFFPMGAKVRWKVPKYVRKVFFQRRPGRIVEVLRTFSVKRLFGRGNGAPVANPLVAP
jgi:uncharacterized cupin superfamily protein